MEQHATKADIGTLRSELGDKIDRMAMELVKLEKRVKSIEERPS